MNYKDIKLVGEKLKIEEKILTNWKDKIKIQEFKIGEIILSNTLITKNILILINGKIRLRGISNNKNNKIFSLGLLESIEIIGLSSNRINQPIEIVSAASNCIFLSIPFEQWDAFQKDINSDFLKLRQRTIDLSEFRFT